MQNVLPILAVLGGILMLFAFAMLVPLAFAYFGHDGALMAYDEAILLTFGCGLLLFLACRRYKRELQPR
ncbi:MAG: TrkH family potassium uptake protein, partial [Aquincola sp.]|nr:TrkH family potassium uptake protein [Aquincola sp.]